MSRPVFVAAWLFGMGLITYRYAVKQHQPPIPGSMLAASGLFALLALVAEYQPAAPAAAMTAWGFDLAALLCLFPDTVGGPGCKPAASKTAAPAAKTTTSKAG